MSKSHNYINIAFFHLTEGIIHLVNLQKVFKKSNLLNPDTHTFMCISEDKKCYFFGKPAYVLSGWLQKSFLGYQRALKVKIVPLLFILLFKILIAGDTKCYFKIRTWENGGIFASTKTTVNRDSNSAIKHHLLALKWFG